MRLHDLVLPLDKVRASWKDIHWFTSVSRIIHQLAPLDYLTYAGVLEGCIMIYNFSCKYIRVVRYYSSPFVYISHIYGRRRRTKL